MLYLGICKTEEINGKYISLLSPIEKEKMEKIRDKKRRSEYLSSHTLLALMKNEILKEEPCVLTYNEYGKPRFEGRDEDFSIAHSDGLAVVLMTDEKNIKLGVDVEKRLEFDSKKTRIEKRFLSDLPDALLKDADMSVCFYLFSLKTHPEKMEKIELKADSGLDFEKKWTRLEALLKMQGTGFVHLNESKEKDAQISTYTYQDYTISIAKEK